MEPLMWDRSKVTKGIKQGRVVGIAVVGGTIQFLLGNGDQRGYLVDQAGGIRRFDEDWKGWRVIDGMKKTASE